MELAIVKKHKIIGWAMAMAISFSTAQPSHCPTVPLSNISTFQLILTTEF
jgi:hypothetical protein